MPKKKHHKKLSLLQKQIEASRSKLQQQYPHAVEKLQSLELDLSSLRQHSTKMLSSAVLAGSMMATTPIIQAVMHPVDHQSLPLSQDQLQSIIRSELARVLPKQIGPLGIHQEQQVTKVIKETLGIEVTGILDGNRLNTTYGRIGGEQHLPRYPGDSINQHDELQHKGITASRGAFGYFASSKAELTPEAIEQEKYYVAVQTMYLPNWNQDHKTLKDWYKFRKVLVVNPTNGKSVVAVVGDAGPAAWTGKHFGGSPEVMAHLEPYADQNNGKVLLFFIEETDTKVALGPVDEKVSSHYLAQK